MCVMEVVIEVVVVKVAGVCVWWAGDAVRGSISIAAGGRATGPISLTISLTVISDVILVTLYRQRMQRMVL